MHCYGDSLKAVFGTLYFKGDVFIFCGDFNELSSLVNMELKSFNCYTNSLVELSCENNLLFSVLSNSFSSINVSSSNPVVRV